MTSNQNPTASRPKLWKSLGQLNASPKFQQWAEREFPEGATETSDADRRDFLKLMGASFGLAGLGLSGCRNPEKKILPYAKQPENIIPGVATYYATSLPGSSENIPLIVETHEARPTKIEGNPSHAAYGGGTSSFAQASVLDLYDPDRQRVARNATGGDLSIAEVRALLTEVHNNFAKSRGKGLAILVQPGTSPTRQRLLDELSEAMPAAIIAAYEPVDRFGPTRAMHDFSGQWLRPTPVVNKAKRILAIDADFLGTEPGHLVNARAFAKGRKVGDDGDTSSMNRLYVAESNFSLTGAMADHRLRLASSHGEAFAALILAELLERSGQENPKLLTALRRQGRVVRERVLSGEIREWLDACVDDLLEHAKNHSSLVIAGADQPAEVHETVHFINQLLGAVGHTVQYHVVPAPIQNGIQELLKALDSGEVDTLCICGGNPAFDASTSELSFVKSARNARQVIRLGFHPDETSGIASITIPESHYLEAWSDGRAWDGAYVPVQPMISPLFESLSEIEFIAAILTGEPSTNSSYELVKETFTILSGTNDDLSFDAWLAEGVLQGSAFPTTIPTQDTSHLTAMLASIEPVARPLAPTELEVRFLPSPHAGDGRYNNNAWLMECPDPMTKLTWDNAILVSPRLGIQLGVIDDKGETHIKTNFAEFKANQHLAPVGRLTVNGGSVEAPVHILPGLADYTVVVHYGFGRNATGRVGTRLHDPEKGKGIGFNVYPVSKTTSVAFSTGASLTLLDGKPPVVLANTQEHWSMEGRAIIREASRDHFSKNPEFAGKMGAESHSPPVYGKDQDKTLAYKSTHIPRGGSLYGHPSNAVPAPNVDVWNTPEGKAAFVAPQQWGMTIDLNSCLGCNACVIACQSENNIPVVGKDQVSRGREMHWIRLDRYFAGGPDDKAVPEDPQVNFMSVACTHCELAPCESVCPVNATVHDEEGLNTMAYNRCVGTRYCANNCPYKVRRFNFFDYNKRVRGDFYKGPLGTNYDKTTDSQLTRLQKNPDVTVRMRGVMEKCTYCVQRIQEAKINQKNRAKGSADVRVPDGTIKVACQQSCPTDCITFGDVSDPDSAVSKAKQSPRDYSLLGYLNTRPRTTYLAKVRNFNPRIAKGSEPWSAQEYAVASGHQPHDSHSEHPSDANHNGHAPHAEKTHH